MNADRVVMDHLVDAAIASRDVIVAPPILHGWFPAFREFPGTEVADPNVFQDYVFHVGLSLAMPVFRIRNFRRCNAGNSGKGQGSTRGPYSRMAQGAQGFC